MQHQHINAETLSTWLKDKQATLIDVRSLWEHQAQSIPDSTSVPLDQLTPEKLQQYTAKKIVLYCQTGQRSETAAAKIAQQASHLDLSVLDGGLDAWKKATYPVNQQKRFFLSLNRQVQLTIGALVLLSSILSYTHPAFTIVTGLLGAGLMSAGITGFCGLARLMEKMPWNQAHT